MGGREEKVLPARSVWPVVSWDQEWHPLPECTVQELPQVELIVVSSGHLGKQPTGTEAGAASASHGSAFLASLAPWPGPRSHRHSPCPGSQIPRVPAEQSSATASPTFRSAPDLRQECWKWVPDEVPGPHKQQAW